MGETKALYCIYRVYKKEKGSAKANNKSTTCEINYLHRQDAEVYLSEGLKNNKQFVQSCNGNSPYRVILSPKNKCNMKELLDVFVSSVKKFNNRRSLKYVAYVHYDTDHPHIQMLIAPPKPDKNLPFDISSAFVQKAVMPEIDQYLEKIQGKQTQEDIKHEYHIGIENEGQCRADYDIKRMCKKTESENVLVFHPEKLENLESWKLDDIQKRIGKLAEDNLCYEKEGKLLFDADFIQKKIWYGKIRTKHKKTLEKHPEIKIEEITVQKLPKAQTEQELSIVEDKEKHAVSHLVKSAEGKIYFYETKKRLNQDKDEKTKKKKQKQKEIAL